MAAIQKIPPGAERKKPRIVKTVEAAAVVKNNDRSGDSKVIRSGMVYNKGIVTPIGVKRSRTKIAETSKAATATSDRFIVGTESFMMPPPD
jgi:hypothetical protein